MEAARPSPRTFSQGVGRFIRRLVLVAALGATALVAIYYCAMYYAGEVIRQQVETKLREHYEPLGLEATLQEARFLKDRGLVLSNLTIREQRSHRAGNIVCSIDEIRIEAPMCLIDLVDMPPAKRVTISGAKFYTSVADDYRLSIMRLAPLPVFSTKQQEKIAPIRFRDSSFIILNDRGEPSVVLDDISALVTTETVADSQVNAPVHQLTVRGTSDCNYMQKLNFVGQYHTATKQWRTRAEVTELAMSRSLVESLPSAFATPLKPVSGLQGKLNLTVDVSHDGSAPTFEVAGKLAEARIDDPRLPYPLTELSADLFANNNGLTVSNLQSRNGLGWLNLSCSKQGLAEDGPLEIRGSARQLELNDRLMQSLPAPLQATWRDLDPTGRVNLDFQLAFDGEKWEPTATVQFLDFSFAHKSFPYRLTGGTGVAYIGNQQATIKLSAMAGRQIVHIDGAFQNPGPNHTGSLTMRTDGPFRIDENVTAALPPDARALVEQFRLAGSVSLWFEYRRDRPTAAAVTNHAVATLQDCEIQFEDFPYPLKKISGTVEINDEQWLLKDLRGANGSASVVCNGNWRWIGTGGKLTLKFNASDVPLNEDLRGALGADVRQLWNAASPRGDIDHLTVDLQHAWPSNTMSLFVKATKWNDAKSTARSISLQPLRFPYRLEDVTGEVTYRNGRIDFKRFTAHHNETQFGVDGWFESGPNQQWRGLMTNVTADRLKVDRELLAALPASVARQLGQVKIDGPISATGKIAMAGAANSNSTKANWDLAFDLENGSLQGPAAIEHIHGGVRLQGSSDQDRLTCRGEIAVDSMFIKGVQLTNVSGPIWTDGNEFFAGAWAPPGVTGQPTRRISADVMGGKLLTDARMQFSEPSPFILQAAFTDGDLTEMAQQAGKMADISGDAYANLELRGSTAGVHTLQGKGAIRLRDARVGELPVMLGLLKLLRVQEPTQTAFDDGDIDFTVEGDNIYFDRLDLRGDAITLRGIGEMNFDRRLNLYFYSVVGRDNVRLPLVTPALWVASRQLLLIRVEGSLDDPQIDREVFPGVNELLQQAFPETGDSPRLARPDEYLSNRRRGGGSR